MSEYPDEKLKRTLHDAGFNLVTFNVKKVPTNQHGNNLTGAANKPHEEIPEYVLKAGSVVVVGGLHSEGGWGIAHSTNMKGTYLMLDWDGKTNPDGTEDPIPPNLLECMLTSRRRAGGWSHHGILHVTDATHEDLQKFCKWVKALNMGMEAFCENQRLVVMGTYNRKDGEQSTWHYRDDVAKRRFEKDGIQKITRSELSNLFAEYAPKDTSKDNSKSTKIEKGGVDITKIPGPSEAFNHYRSVTMKLAGEGDTREKIFLTCQGTNLQRTPKPFNEEELWQLIDSAIDEAKKSGVSKKTKPQKEKEEKRKFIMELMKQITSQYNFCRVLEEKESNLYVEQNRTYQKYGVDFLGRLIIDKVPDRDPTVKQYIVEYVKDYYYASQDEFDNDHHILNFKNTFYDLKTDKAIEQPTGYKSLYQHPVEYRPELGRSEEYEELVKQILPEEGESRLELSGLMFLRSLVNPEKIFIHDGDGANGKSTLMHIDVNIIGEKNITSIKPEDIANDQYAPAELYGKFGCIAHDISSGTLEGISVLKSLAMRDEIISAQHKYGHRFEFKNHAMIQAACNRPPKIKEFDYAEARRFHLLLYSERFEGDDKKDEYHKEFLDTEEKRSKILNTMLYYAQRMLKSRGKLTNPQSPTRVLEIWNNEVQSVNLFIDNVIEKTEDIDDKVPIKTMYAKYQDECQNLKKYKKHTKECIDGENCDCPLKFQVENPQKFSRLLTKKGFEKKQFTIPKTRNREWCWIGVRIPEETTQATLGP